MIESLKNGRYANIDVARFETNQGVTKALDMSTGETVIVKAILLQNTNHWKSTQQEAATLRQLDHANVVRFVDFLDRQTPDWAEFGAMSFIIMENCAGGSLVDWIEKMKQAGRKPTMDEATLVGAQIISGLSYCHERNKLHLDLKPANIFVLGDFITVKLGDFGSALSVSSVHRTVTTRSGDVIGYTPLYAAPEILSGEEVKKSPRLDVWGFALVLQEVLTLEHAFGRVNGGNALFTEIQTNIQKGNRTSLFEIFGETDEFEEFEILLEKCSRLDRKKRPRNAIKLRDEALFVDFLGRIESGERPSSIVPPPFPNENDEIERLKHDIELKDRRIQELENRLDYFNEIMEDRLRDEAKERNQQIAMQNRKNQQLKHENEDLKRELTKMKNLNSELEQNFEYSRKIIEKQKNEIERLGRELNEKSSQKDEKREEVRNKELEKLRKELGGIGGAGEFFGNDKWTGRGGVRDEMKEEELRNVLKLLALGEKTINLKFRYFHNWEVAEAGWHLQLKSSYKKYGGDGWYHLSIWKKEGGGKFKAVAQEIDHESGEERNRQEIESEADGQRQTIKYKMDICWNFVRFNVYFL